MPAKIITVTGYKGGVGKSTTAIHVATFLSQHGKTILVDGDPNRTAVNWAARGSLPFEVVDERRAMKAIAGKDWVVFDTPARPDSSDLKEMAEGCDLLILPTTPDVVSLQPMLEIARDLGKNKRVKFRTLITIVPPPPNTQGEAMREDLRANGMPVFETLIRRTVGYHKAALAGKPIKDIDDHRARAAWEDYEALGQEILELL